MNTDTVAEQLVRSVLNALGAAHLPLEGVPLDGFRLVLAQQASDHPVNVQVLALVDAAIAFRDVSREAVALDKALAQAGGLATGGGVS